MNVQHNRVLHPPQTSPSYGLPARTVVCGCDLKKLHALNFPILSVKCELRNFDHFTCSSEGCFSPFPFPLFLG